MGWENATFDEMEQSLSHFFGLSSAAWANACDVIVEADRAQVFLADGSPDMVQWLSSRYGLAHRTARRLVETARRLTGLPLLTERFRAGDMSFDQVEAISKVATAENEPALIDEALGLTVAGVERLVRTADAPDRAQAAGALNSRYCYIQRSFDGLADKMTTQLPGAEMSIVESAIRERADRIPANPETGLFDPYPQRMADGLVELASTTSGEATPAQVTVFADLESLTDGPDGVTETDLGSILANDTARRLSCDSIVECAVFSRNQPLGVGRNSRTVPRWLRRQLWKRDGGCRFPGCGRINWVHAHHVVHWADGGATDLDNLILLCGFHHRFLHEHGWSITATEIGFQFRRADGESYPPDRPRLNPRLRALVDISI